MPTYGEWRDDSVPFWTMVGLRNTTQPGWTWNSYAGTPSTSWDADPRLADTWAGTGDERNGPEVGTGSSAFSIDWNRDNGAGNVAGSFSSWSMVWLTVERYDPTITSGVLPSSVYNATTGTYTDPNVIGVEWGAAGPALAQRLLLTMRGGWAHPPGAAIHVKVSGTTEPPFMTGADVAAVPDLATIPDAGFVEVLNPPVAVEGADTLTLGLVDTYTQAQAGPALPPGERFSISLTLPFNARIEGQYAPPYRLIYGDATAARRSPLRLTQRGDGLTGAPRLLGNKTRQSTNRLLGGAF